MKLSKLLALDDVSDDGFYFHIYNPYGMVSGGYQFTAMDTYAHKILRDMLPSDCYIVTSEGTAHWHKQVCDIESITLRYSNLQKHNNNSYTLKVSLYAPVKGKRTLCSDCTFTFKFAHHNYCEL